MNIDEAKRWLIVLFNKAKEEAFNCHQVEISLEIQEAQFLILNELGSREPGQNKGGNMEAFEVLSNIKNWTGYDFKGYALSKAEAETCINALEKATPKNPKRGAKYFWQCPECGKPYADEEENWHNFCSHCGQAIRWNKEEDHD